jgi:hypothetical protein
MILTVLFKYINSLCKKIIRAHDNLLALVQILFGPKKVVPSSQDQFLDL